MFASFLQHKMSWSRESWSHESWYYDTESFGNWSEQLFYSDSYVPRYITCVPFKSIVSYKWAGSYPFVMLCVLCNRRVCHVHVMNNFVLYNCHVYRVYWVNSQSQLGQKLVLGNNITKLVIGLHAHFLIAISHTKQCSKSRVFLGLNITDIWTRWSETCIM